MMRNERAAFVPRRRRTRNLAALVLAISWAGRAPAQDVGAPSLPGLRIHARSYSPGEILRIEAQRTDCPAVSATGEFLDVPFSLAKLDSPLASPRFVGWAAIPLDRKEGTARIAVTLECGEDIPYMKVQRDIQIAAKTFPEQKLEVEEKFVNPPKAALARIEREKAITDKIYKRRTPLAPPTDPFVPPVPGSPTSEFGAHRILNGQPKAPHPGIDLQAATGTPVQAAGPGTVALASDLYYSGGTIIIDHGSGLFTVYAHLSKIETKEGSAVHEGERLGLSGATGRVTGPHLHWGARVGDTIVDPRGLLDPKVFKSP